MSAPENISLYVHWPFCEAKCPYCDFNSHVREKIDAARYEAALLRELDYFLARQPDRNLTSIFFGGGTPSLMPPETVERIIEKASQGWNPGTNLEITLEANPGSSEADKFQDFRKAGVNRLSLGVQSFDNEQLKFLGRIHSAAEAERAIEMARYIFPRFSFDLIYARPGQTEKEWKKELEQALALADGHLSLYQLTLEKDTAFYRQAKRGQLALPDVEIGADLYALTKRICEDAGLPAYEISNYARPGLESRHNLNYWQGGAYVGIGPGAHSRLRNNQGNWQAFATVRTLENWLETVEQRGAGIEISTPLEPRERGEEIIMTAFRLEKGLHKKTFQETVEHTPFDLMDQDQFRALEDEGFVFENDNFVGLTAKGRPVLDHLLGALLA